MIRLKIFWESGKISLDKMKNVWYTIFIGNNFMPVRYVKCERRAYDKGTSERTS